MRSIADSSSGVSIRHRHTAMSIPSTTHISTRALYNCREAAISQLSGPLLSTAGFQYPGDRRPLSSICESQSIDLNLKHGGLKRLLNPKTVFARLYGRCYEAKRSKWGRRDLAPRFSRLTAPLRRLHTPPQMRLNTPAFCLDYDKD